MRLEEAEIARLASRRVVFRWREPSPWLRAFPSGGGGSSVFYVCARIVINASWRNTQQRRIQYKWVYSKSAMLSLIRRRVCTCLHSRPERVSAFHASSTAPFTWLLPSLGGHALDSVRMTANQSPVPGEDIDPLSDPEERRVLYAALDSFR